MSVERRPDRRTVIRLAGLGAVGWGLAACSGNDEASGRGSAGDPQTRTSAPADQQQDSSTPSASAAEPRTVVATAVVDQLQVFGAPRNPDTLGRPGRAELTLDRTTRVTGQLVLLALEVGIAWTRVQLPVRPNGSIGWVRSSAVSLSGHDFAIDIALDAHLVVVTNGDREVLRSPVGVGRADRPTPGGDYFTTELLRPPDPDGLYGPYAYGLSGYSDVLMDFRGGEGVIGIHGTNEPELVGTDVSSGCIRLPNEQIIRMVEQIGLPLGTPVTIR
ncbi:MAG: L,D-transpeptidase [Ornithinimicrobium sp.]